MTASVSNIAPRRAWRSAAAVAAAVALLAACGSDEKSASTTAAPSATTAAPSATTAAPSATTAAPSATTAAPSATTAAPADDCAAAAAAGMAPYENEPTTLPAEFTALKAKPEAGGKIINVSNSNIPSDLGTADEMKTAAAAVGWTADQVVFDGTVEDANAKFLDAVDQKPTAIAMAGFPLAALQTSIDAAKEAGVIVVLASVADSPVSYPGLAGVANGTAANTVLGQANAYKLMTDSDCKGKVLTVTAPFDILNVLEKGMEDVLDADCPDCGHDVISVNPADIGSPKIAQQIVAKIQADPSINYIFATFGNLVDGVDAALSQAGISGVKIFGNVPDEASVKALQGGTNAWWITQGSILQAWLELDTALRVIEAQGTVEVPAIPFWFVTPDNVPSSGTEVPTYPQNFRDLYKQLWGV